MTPIHMAWVCDVLHQSIPACTAHAGLLPLFHAVLSALHVFYICKPLDDHYPGSTYSQIHYFCMDLSPQEYSVLLRCILVIGSECSLYGRSRTPGRSTSSTSPPSAPRIPSTSARKGFKGGLTLWLSRAARGPVSPHTHALSCDTWSTNK